MPHPICSCVYDPPTVFWSEGGDNVTLCCEDAFYVLSCDRTLIAEAVRSGNVEEDGVDDSFTLKHSFGDKVRTGVWVGDCFIFMTKQRINYYVGGKVRECALTR